MEFNIKNNNNNKKPIKPEGDRTVSKQKDNAYILYIF